MVSKWNLVFLTKLNERDFSFNEKNNHKSVYATIFL